MLTTDEKAQLIANALSSLILDDRSAENLQREIKMKLIEKLKSGISFQWSFYK